MDLSHLQLAQHFEHFASDSSDSYNKYVGVGEPVVGASEQMGDPIGMCGWHGFDLHTPNIDCLILLAILISNSLIEAKFAPKIHIHKQLTK